MIKAEYDNLNEAKADILSSIKPSDGSYATEAMNTRLRDALACIERACMAYKAKQGV